MNVLNKEMTGKVDRPIKVLQFGEGNFLRAFVDYMIDHANESTGFNGDIVLVKPITYGNLEQFHKQECQYTVSLRGIEQGEKIVKNRVITSVADAVDATNDYEQYVQYGLLDSLRFIVSNTTEAGIVYDEKDQFELNPPTSYPGKLTKLLYQRFEKYQGDVSKGLIILPVELIDDNGIKLKECVVKLATRWGLEEGFLTWVEEACTFCSTLVDRIVTGYPREEAAAMWEEFGYEDQLLVTAEPFGLWVIESERDIREQLPLDQAGMPVIFTDNQKPYKQRKVRILNGAHTSFVLASYLAGNDIVLESMQDDTIREFMNSTIFKEVIPTLTLPENELKEFAHAVIDRFNNPFIKHSLLAISLNSVSKWRARCMPSFLAYIEKTGELPKHLSFSLAALIAFYKRGTKLTDGALIGLRDGQEYKIIDDKDVLEFFLEHGSKPNCELAKLVMSNVNFFGQDLTKEEGALALVVEYLDDMDRIGIRKVMEKLG